jgi:chemotaxis protein methyltransferase CheR
MIDARPEINPPESPGAKRRVREEAGAYAYIADLVYQRCGIRLHHGKEELINSRLGKRMRRHGLSRLTQYVEFLQTQADEQEFKEVIDALTTNFTSFMREGTHFQHLVQQALPSVLRPNQRAFRVWSAACSSGEEPYTIAFHLAENFPLLSGWDWHITATDISKRVLEHAQRGTYSAERLSAVPRPWLPKYFQRGLGRWEGYFRVKSLIAERIAFGQLNLIEPYELSVVFEVIFCRNVMIYFDRPTQERLVRQLCRFLVPGGYLFTGHAESLNGLQLPLRYISPSIYRKESP